MRHFGEINGIKVALTDHALSRMVEMGMTSEELIDLLSNPEEIYPSTKYPDCTNYRKGDYSLALLQEGDTYVIKTVLYGTMTAWLKAHKEGKLPGDRPLKINKSLKRW